MWQFPWKYKESFSIALALFCIGVLLQTFAPLHLSPLEYPINIVVGFNFLLIPILLQIFAPNNAFVQWLGNVPAALSSIALFTILSLIMGFVPQSNQVTTNEIDLGFTHILTSWQYILAEIYFLFSLGMVSAKRAIPFKLRNTGFLLNHFGLWLVIVGIALGYGDKQKVILQLFQNKTEWRGYNQKQQLVALPIALQLHEFKITDYNPSIIFIDNVTQKLLDDKKHQAQFLLEPGAQTTQHGWTIVVKQYLSDAALDQNTFVSFNKRGSVPAAFISAKKDAQQVEGWISCGNFMSPNIILHLNESISLGMSSPQPKCYSSRLSIYTNKKQQVDTTIEVNKPFQIGGWKLYQTGFDDKKGKWSDFSIIEAVYDPWLPLIYTGMIMLLIGAIFIFWKGRGNKE